MNENQPYRHIALNQAEVRELFDAFIVDSREQTRLLREGKRVCNQSPTFDTTAFNIWWARRGQAYVTGSRFEAEYCPKTKTGSLRMLVPVEYPMPKNDEARDDALLALLDERDANERYRQHELNAGREPPTVEELRAGAKTMKDTGDQYGTCEHGVKMLLYCADCIRDRQSIMKDDQPMPLFESELSATPPSTKETT